MNAQKLMESYRKKLTRLGYNYGWEFYDIVPDTISLISCIEYDAAVETNCPSLAIHFNQKLSSLWITFTLDNLAGISDSAAMRLLPILNDCNLISGGTAIGIITREGENNNTVIFKSISMTPDFGEGAIIEIFASFINHFSANSQFMKDAIEKMITSVNEG